MYKPHLTSPEQHDPDNFVYIVHGIMNRYCGVKMPDLNIPDSDAEIDVPKIDFSDIDFSDPSKIDWSKVDKIIGKYPFIKEYNYPCNTERPDPRSSVQHALRKIQDPNDFYSASLVGRLTQDRTKQKFGMCGRDISQLGIFGNFGFILQPEDQDVWIAWDNDVGTPEDKYQRRIFANKHRGKRKGTLDLLQTPLSYSRSNSYNELVVKGNPATPVVGLFYVVMNEKSESKGRIFAEQAMTLLKKQVPVIPIPSVKDEEDKNEDPKVREQLRELRGLQMQVQTQQSHIEFQNYFGQKENFNTKSFKYGA